jgi:sugar phosphate isomerase/epimerase
MRRRDLLRTLAVTAAAGAALPGAAAAARAVARVGGTHRSVGIQLYSVRELFAADPARTLAALAEIGYEEVELTGLHGRSARETRRLLDANGLRAPAGHVALEEVTDGWERTLENAEILGHEYVIVPWIDAGLRTLEGYARLAAVFNETGARARAAGLRFAYHNHDYEFLPIDGIVPYDLLLERTDPELVALELDLYWAVVGGADPLAYYARHPGRFPLVHVKDRDAEGRMVSVGAGVIDFAEIFARSDLAGTRHYFVEHDNPADPLAFARSSYAHVRGLLK